MLDDSGQRPRTFRVIATLAGTFYSLFCFTWIIINRVYLKAYYLSTNAAIIGIFLGATLLLQSTGFPVGIWLKLFPKESRCRIFSDVVMLFLWVANLLLFFTYAGYASTRPTVNRDAVIAACVFVINFFMILSSRIMSGTARKEQSASYSCPQEDHEVRRPNLRSAFMGPLVLGLCLYTLLVFGTLYEVICKVRDWNNYRPNRFMHKVQMTGHLPMYIYLRCEGNGTQTILMEEGLIGTSLVSYEFVPIELSKNYKVCLYDRLGSGWSDSIESDRVTNIAAGLNSNVHRSLMRSLILKANLSRPLVLAAHGLGSWHITLYALAYPRDVSALIYIDGARFWVDNTNITSALEDATYKASILRQFSPTGWPRLLAETNPGAVAAYFSPYIDWNGISEPTRNEILATVFGGSFLAQNLMLDKFMFLKHTKKSESSVRDLAARFPILLIDSDYDWFPKFSRNISAKYSFVHMPNSTHMSIFFSKKWAQPVSQEIVKFLKKMF